MFKHIGEAISYYRQKSGITREELAAKVGIDTVSIIKIENCQIAISVEKTEVICKSLSIQVDSLFEQVEPVVEEEAMSSDIKRIELLIDALFTQEQIYNARITKGGLT